MGHWDIAFLGSWPAALVMAGALVASLLAYAFYRRKRPVLSRLGFSVLACLRLLVILVAALFLLQPALRIARVKASRSTVAVLVDVSESMTIRDAVGDVSRLEAGLALLTQEAHELTEQLGRGHQVRLFSFGAVTDEMADVQAMARLSADRKATALGGALIEVLKRTRGESLAGIIVLTDGVSNRGVEPERAAATLGVPVFPVALGGRVAGRGRFHDVGISRIPQSPHLIVNNRATIEVELAHAGLRNFTDAEREMPVRLTDGDLELATRLVALPPEDGITPVELEFVPSKVGIHRLRVSVAELSEEMVTENNGRTLTVHVTDPRLRILIVEGVARNEYRFLRRVLESDPNLEVTAVVKLSRKRFLSQGVQPGIDLSRGLPARREDYDSFDVIILGDIGREEFSDLQLAYLKAFVGAGGALMALGGYHVLGPGGYAGSALDDLLPVVVGGKLDGHIEGAFVPLLTATGRGHPVFAGCSEFFNGIQPRGALDGANKVKGVKPGAELLAVHPYEKVEGRSMPVVAIQSYGSGRVMVLTADTTWKWKFQMEALGMESPYYRFWRQSARWLAARKDGGLAQDQPVCAWTEKIEYGPDEPVTLKARVRNAAGVPEANARLEVTIAYPVPVKKAGPDGGEILESEALVGLELMPLTLGEYQGRWRPPADGLYRATARAETVAGALGADVFEFVVGRADDEFDRVDVAEATLRSLAVQTGGAYHTLATAGRIPDELEQRRSMLLHREEINLWNAPWMFAVFLTCATAEWVLRKRRGLN